MADISVTVGMDKSQFDNGLREMRAQAAAASGSVGQSFQVAGAKMQGFFDPVKKFNAGLASGVSAVTGLIGPIAAAIGLATAAFAVFNKAQEEAKKEAARIREEYERMAESIKNSLGGMSKQFGSLGIGSDLLNQQKLDEAFAAAQNEALTANVPVEETQRLLQLANEERKRAQVELDAARVREADISVEKSRQIALQEQQRASQEELNNQLNYELSLRHNMKQIEEARREEEERRNKEALDFATAYNESERHMSMVQAELQQEQTRRDRAGFAGSFGPGLLGAGLASRALGAADSVPAEMLAAQRRLAEVVPTKLSELVALSKETLLAVRGGARA